VRLGIDIGGTFTDFTLLTPDGSAVLWKEASTPHDPLRAVRDGLGELARRHEFTEREFLDGLTLVVHGTTIATNTVLQRTGARTGLLCTDGFRDVLYFRDGYKPERFDMRLPRVEEFVPRYLRVGVRERVDRDGNVREPLDEVGVRRAAELFAEAEVESVAVAFLWSVVNPTHEQAAAALLRKLLPGVHVLCSVDVLPEMREWERTSATVLSAYVLPGIDSYLRGVEHEISADRTRGRLLIMQNNGGCNSVADVLRQPVNVLASGPAAAPAAALAAAAAADADLVVADMGGTSFDVCVIRRGQATISRDVRVEGQPIGVPAVDVHSVGAGGGSIAWVDDGGALRVGPQSAGSQPGPAAYGAGGDRPTVTDANVVLGYLDPARFLGGRRRLDAARAHEALARDVGARLGIDSVRAAAGVIELVDANMARAIRRVSIERGVDPRRFTLLAGGGACGLHAARLARALGMAKVLVPRQASTLCAFGMTVTDVRHDFARSSFVRSDRADPAAVGALLEELKDAARNRLADEGFTPEQIRLEAFADARYPRQVHELTVAAPGVDRYADEHVRAIEVGFHDAHREEFGYCLDDSPVEILHWRVVAHGHTGHAVRPARPVTAVHEPAPSASRPAYVPAAGGLVPVEVYRSDGLEAGSRISGPAVLDAGETTIWLPEGDTLDVTRDGSYEIMIPPERDQGEPR